MAKYDSFKDWLLEDLVDANNCIDYLNDALEDEDPRFFLVALKDIVDANGGVTIVAKKARVNRASMYKTLSGKGYPNILTITKILNALGIGIKMHKKEIEIVGNRDLKSSEMLPNERHLK